MLFNPNLSFVASSVILLALSLLLFVIVFVFAIGMLFGFILTVFFELSDELLVFTICSVSFLYVGFSFNNNCKLFSCFSNPAVSFSSALLKPPSLAEPEELLLASFLSFSASLKINCASLLKVLACEILSLVLPSDNFCKFSISFKFVSKVDLLFFSTKVEASIFLLIESFSFSEACLIKFSFSIPVFVFASLRCSIALLDSKSASFSKLVTVLIEFCNVASTEFELIEVVFSIGLLLLFTIVFESSSFNLLELITIALSLSDFNFSNFLISSFNSFFSLASFAFPIAASSITIKLAISLL